ncbi:MAG: hypothetical protein ACI8PZ_003427 [Myxococcota bacterium]|jgi:hypothetical protein
MVRLMAVLLVGCVTDRAPTWTPDQGDPADGTRSFGWQPVDQVQVPGIGSAALHAHGASAHMGMAGVTCLWREGGIDSGWTGPFDEDDDVEEGDEDVVAGTTTTDLGDITALRSAAGLTLLVERGTSTEEPRGDGATLGEPNSWAILRNATPGVHGGFLDDGRFLDLVPHGERCAVRTVSLDGSELLVGGLPFDCAQVSDTAVDPSGVLFAAAGGRVWRFDVHGTSLSLLTPSADRVAWDGVNGRLVTSDRDGVHGWIPTSDGWTAQWTVVTDGPMDHLAVLPSGEVVGAQGAALWRWRHGEVTGLHRVPGLRALSVATAAERVLAAGDGGFSVLRPE